MPTYSIGVISDVQYADIDNANNYANTVVRRYRQSLSILETAAICYGARKVSCAVMLGDMIDGQAAGNGTTEECLSSIMGIIDKNTDCPWHFVNGNHEYYNFSRDSLHKMIPASYQSGCSATKLYYDFVPFPGCRCIMLDGYDISTIGHSSVEHHDQATETLVANNPNFVPGEATGNWLKNLTPAQLRYVPYNGGIGTDQLQWLECVLQGVCRNNISPSDGTVYEQCLIFCHMPLHIDSSKHNNLLWNCEEVLSVIHKYCNAVIAVFAGHDHGGGYTFDDTHGIHHFVPPAPIECDEGEEAYGVLNWSAPHSTTVTSSFHADIELTWTGKPIKNLGNFLKLC